MLDSIHQAFSLLGKGSRSWLIAYLLSAMLAAILEVLGLSLIFAFFQVAMDTGDSIGSFWILQLQTYLGMLPQAKFLSILAVIVIVVFVIRTALLMLTSWVTLGMRRHVELFMVGTMLRSYLRKPLVWHLERGSFRLINNLASNVGMVVQHIIIGTLDLVGIVTTLLLIFVTMSWLRPFETGIVVLVLGFAGAIYFFFVQHRSLGWGRQMVMASEARWRSVREPLRGIKTVKVFNLEDYFAQQVDMHTRVFLDVFLKQGMIQAAPRLFLEILVVSGAMLAMVLALTAGYEPQNIIPAMALFGVATIRILPLVTKMLQTLQYIRYSESALATLYEDMTSLSDQSSIPSRNSTNYFESLSLRNVSFTYPGAPRKAINSASLEIRPGEQIALVGLSGAGKTTLADLLLGLIKPEEGQIIHNGQPCNNVPDGLFAYVPQEPFIIHDTLRRNIALGLADHLIDESAVISALEAAALSSLVKKLPYGLETIMGEDGKGLSGGERQRLGIARALYRDASVLIMDEPTSSLDALTEAEISTTITSLRGRKTVILIAHRLSSIKSFDRIVFIDDGRVAASGTFRELYDEFVQFRTMVDFLSVSRNSESKL